MKARPQASPDQGVQDWLRWRSGVSPEMLALKAGPVEWTYEELQERVSDLSALLLSWGAKRGERVALLLQPSEVYVALVHAITRIGAVAVPLNHRQSGAELLRQLRDSDPWLVVYDDALGEKVKGEIMKGERGRAGRSGRSLAIPPRPRLWKRASQLSTTSRPRGTEPVRGDPLDASSLHSIVYTSGSSGAPKGVELTVSNIMWNAVSFGLRNGGSVADRWLLAMPLFHVGGYTIIFRSVIHGSGMVIHPGFEAGRVSDSLDGDEITLASFVPTMLTEVLDSRGSRPFPPRLRLVFLGGAPPPESLMTKVRERRLPVVLTYGMTETCSQIALSHVGGAAQSADQDGAAMTAYQPMFPNEVAIKHERKDGVTARPGEVGEIVVRGPTVFSGYWRDRKTSEASFDGRWFRTGDIGFRSQLAGGEFVILGRRDEMIISGGEHIYPVEVESSLRSHKAIKDAVVIGRKDERWGQRAEAVLEVKDGFRQNPPSESELVAFLRDRIGRYKVPKAYHFWAALPRTPTGKVKREAVKRLLEKASDVD